MRLNLIEIVNNAGAKIEFSRTLDLSDVVLRDGTQPFTRPVTISGKAVNFAGDLRLEAAVECVCSLMCARCLRAVDLPVRAEISAAIRSSDDRDDAEAELVPIIGNAVELRDIAEGALISELPSKPLCKDDCAGLCARCGQDLNIARCNCEEL